MKVILDSVNSSERELALIREAFGDTISVQIIAESIARTVTVDAVQLRRAVAILATDAEYDPDGMETM